MKPEERKRILEGKQGKKRPASRNRQGQGKNGETPPKMSFQESVLSWVKTIVGALLIVMVINGLLVASFVVPTGSMEDEVMTGDFLFVQKVSYGGSSPQTIPFVNIPLPYFRLPGFTDPAKGDVIVFVFPGNRDEVEAQEFQYYLKRCVATAGDTLEVRSDKVYVNGVLQPDPRNVKRTNRPTHPSDHLMTFPEGAHFTRDNWGPMRIPKEGDVIPLNDSTYTNFRYFILREGHDIRKQGEIILIDDQPATSYTVERNYVFGMGDNRHDSQDSRYFGFIPEENVIGTPMFVYWSWSPDIPITNFGDKIGSIRWSRIFTGID